MKGLWAQPVGAGADMKSPGRVAEGILGANNPGSGPRGPVANPDPAIFCRGCGANGLDIMAVGVFCPMTVWDDAADGGVWGSLLADCRGVAKTMAGG